MFSLFSSGLRDACCWLRLLRSRQRFPRPQGLQGEGRVSLQEGRREQSKSSAFPEVQGGAEGQVPECLAQMLNLSGTTL